MASTVAELMVKVAADVTGAIKGFVDVEVGAKAMVMGVANASKSFDEFESSCSRIGSKLTGLGTTMTAALTLPIAGVGLASIKMAADFELGMRKVTSLMGSVSQGEFKQLSNATLELSKELGIDAVGATHALYEAISANVPKENAIDFLRVAAVGAIAGATDTKVAVDALTTVINAFHLKVSDAKEITDAMFAGVNIGKFTFEQLAASIGIASSTASVMGVSYKELIAAGTTISGQGVTISEGMTQIQAAMKALLAPNKQMNELLRATGFASGEALVKAKGFEGALGAIREAANGNLGVLEKATGRIEGFKAILELTGDNAHKTATDLDGVKNSIGSTEKAAGQINESTLRGFDMFKAQVSAIAIQLGTALLPAVNQLLKDMKPVVAMIETAVNWFVKLPEPVKNTALAILGAAAVMGPMVIVAGQLVEGFSKLVGGWSVAVPIAASFAGAVKNVGFAVANDMTGALSAGESVILKFGQAASLAAAAFVGWEIGKWAYSHIPGVKALGDALGGLILKIPGVEAVMNKMTGASDAMSHAMTDQAFVVAKLEQKLKEHGVTVDKTGLSTDQYIVKLREQAKALSVTPVNDHKTAVEALVGTHDKAAVAAGKHGEATGALGGKHKDAGLAAAKHAADVEAASAKIAKAIQANLDWAVKYNEKTKTMNAQEEDAWIHQQLVYAKVQLEMRADGAKTQEITVSQWNQMPGAVSASIQKIQAAYKTLGISIVGENKKQEDSAADLAKKAVAAYDTLAKSGTASAKSLTVAYDAMVKAQIAAIKEGADEESKAESNAAKIKVLEAQQAYKKIMESADASKLEQIAAAWELKAAQVAAAKAAAAELTIAEDGIVAVVKGRMATIEGEIALGFHDASMKAAEAVGTLATDIVGDLLGGNGSVKDSFAKAVTAIKESWGGLKDIFKSVITDLAKQVSDFVTEKIEKMLIGSIMDAIGATSKLGSALGSVLGSGASAGASAAGTVASGAASTAASAGGSAASSAAGIASSVAGAAASSLGGIVTAVASVGQLISSIVGNFQMAKMETTLNAIEKSTRYTEIFTGEQGQSVLWSTQKTAERLNYVNGSLDDLRAKWQSDIPVLIEAVKGGGTSDTTAIFNSIDSRLYWVNGSLDDIRTKLATIIDSLANGISIGRVATAATTAAVLTVAAAVTQSATTAAEITNRRADAATSAYAGASTAIASAVREDTTATVAAIGRGEASAAAGRGTQTAAITTALASATAAIGTTTAAAVSTAVSAAVAAVPRGGTVSVPGGTRTGTAAANPQAPAPSSGGPGALNTMDPRFAFSGINEAIASGKSNDEIIALITVYMKGIGETQAKIAQAVAEFKAQFQGNTQAWSAAQITAIAQASAAAQQTAMAQQAAKSTAQPQVTNNYTVTGNTFSSKSDIDYLMSEMTRNLKLKGAA